jgi:hypothetical protein|tara:strand:- start:179 stop:526 length:348 start_codon:yes stop_codon:yes gene_type:complete
MPYWNNPNFLLLQDYPYNKKQIDDFIIRAYKMGKTKVIHNKDKYVVKNEIERIKKYKKFRLTKPIPTKNNLKKSKENENKRMKNMFKDFAKKLKKNKKTLKKNPKKKIVKSMKNK